MTQIIELSSDLNIDLVDSMGTDLTVVNAARVSLNQHSDEMSEKDAGLVNYLMKNKHLSPFEHCQISFLISAPIFVAREWHRHRVQSFNEISGRYTELKPKFYVPSRERPLIQVGKPGAYKFEASEVPSMYARVKDRFQRVCQFTWDEYQGMLGDGVAKEVARMVLPVTTYTGWYATGNLRNWLGFLALRTDIQAMYEIRMLADKAESLLTDLYPVTMDSWNKNDRGSL